MTNPEPEELLQLLEQLLPAERGAEMDSGKAQIDSLEVLVELMLLQRLSERGTQQEAVHRITAGAVDRLLPDSKRVRAGKISNDTGGYARACGRLSLSRMEQVSDELLRAVNQRIAPDPELQVPVLLLDGTGLSLAHEDQLLKDYPGAPNQHGVGHWGMLRLVGLHDVHTGIGLRPAWGPMFGPEAVSEQSLAREVLAQAPAESIIIGDANFGIFSMAYLVAQSQRRLLFRLPQQRAKAMGAQTLLPTGEQWIIWKRGRKDDSDLNIPKDAKLEGRLIAITQDGFREPLYLFTTLTDPLDKVVGLYCKRWNMELDWRTLKCTLRVHHLRAKSRAAMEKELLIAVLGYGLVRAFMALAAQRADLSPRRLSFTRCWGLLNALTGKLCSPVEAERQAAFYRILEEMGKAKLPNRATRRSYPREIWGFRRSFPRRGPSTHKGESK